jgi:hypothetical protein
MPKRSALRFHDAIEARAWITDPKGGPQELHQKITRAIVTYPTEQALTPEALGLPAVGAGVHCPGWWLSDHDRMASAAINLRVMAFFFQREAYLKRRQDGRPRDGNRFELVMESRKLGVTVRTLAQLLAGLKNSPPGLEDRRVAFSTPVPSEWYEVREEAWFRGLNEALKQERDHRKTGGKPAEKI